MGKGFTGYWNSVRNAVVGTYTAASHPIETVQGIASAARHPILTAQAIASHVAQKAESGTAGQTELVGDVLLAIIGNKVNATVIAKLKNLKLPSIGACFTRDTLVGTATGLRPIAQIESGERVWAFDFKEGDWRLCEVECRTDSQYEGILVRLSIGESQVTATANHPFWVIEGHELEKRPALGHLDVSADRGESLPGRWVNSQDLNNGDVVFSRAEGPVAVNRIQHNHECVPVCNLTIRVLHTFSVGEAQSLVHNSTGSKSVPPSSPRTFSSSDPLVADLANKIEAANPGHVVGVNVPIKNAAGDLVTDADILLQNAAIQVKSGGGKGLASQIVRTEQATGLPTIGYGPTLKPSVVKNIQNSGGLVTKDEAVLLEVIKP